MRPLLDLLNEARAQLLCRHVRTREDEEGGVLGRAGAVHQGRLAFHLQHEVRVEVQQLGCVWNNSI